jgi:hypothetical protein
LTGSRIIVPNNGGLYRVKFGADTLGSRIIELSFPEKSGQTVKTLITEVKISGDVITIYDAVSFFMHNIYPTSKRKREIIRVKQHILLRDILNIHNDDGIKDREQVRTMMEDIRSGRDILPHGIPNVKLARTTDNTLLLFDGHHSMLAYMAAGRSYLEEIPYLIIYDKESGHIPDKDVVIFFGEHSREIENNNWRDKAINWQVPRENQLCGRVQRSMGDLFEALKKEFMITV